jgi:hypothetical protein
MEVLVASRVKPLIAAKQVYAGILCSTPRGIPWARDHGHSSKQKHNRQLEILASHYYICILPEKLQYLILGLKMKNEPSIECIEAIVEELEELWLWCVSVMLIMLVSVSLASWAGKK